MTSNAGDKCQRVAGADETEASCAPPAAICATKNIARGAQSPPRSQVAQGDDDDDRCSCSGAQNDASPGGQQQQPAQLHSEQDSHKVAATRRDFTSARGADANLCTDASSISDSSRQEAEEEGEDEEDTLRRCENLERWREDEQEAEEEEDDDSENVVELESPTGADDEMGAHLSGREVASEGEEQQQQQQSGHSQSAPRASRAQRSTTKQSAGAPTVFDEGRTGCPSQQPMASRDKRSRRARTTHAASNSAATAAGASAIAPATMNQNRTQITTTTSTSSSKNNINNIINSQLFTSATNSNKFTNLQQSTHQNTGRPASAMAGSVGVACKTDYWATCTPSPAASSRTPPPPSVSNQQRAKTTRVRINSTSEQIQDPNWLIQMSREYELKQQSKRAGFPAHFKSLQQKLKSTIVGSSSSSSTTDASMQAGPPEQNKSTSTTSATTNSQQQENSSASAVLSSSTLPPPVPMTPVKMPVSILKQPGSNRTPLKSVQVASQHAKSPSMGQQTEGLQARPQSRNQSTGRTSKQQLSESSNKQQQQQQVTITGKQQQQTGTTKQQTGGKKSATVITNETLAKQAAATPAQATQPTPEAASTKNDLSAPNPAKKAPSVPSQQSATTTTTTTTTTQTATASTSPLTHHPIPGCQQQTAPTSRPVPICADGQVKVSGWKRNNLLAKTLSHFDEIRGNQRPIFMPTKITLPPEKRSPSPSASASTSSPTPPPPIVSLAVPTASQESRRGSSSSTAKLKITTDLTAGGTRFAGIVREAILKKSLLGAHNSAASPTKRVSQDDGTAVAAASERHQSCDLGNPANWSSPVKRPVSADPARSSVSSQSGGGGLGQPKTRKQLHSDSTSAAAGQQQQQGAHSQQASPSHHRQQQRDSGPRTSMAQIIAAAVAAASNDSATAGAAGQRSSFSLPSASVAASSSRAFKLQLKNEQVLQQLRRQSNEHRESLTIDLNNNNNNIGAGNLRQESSSSANEAGGGGGSVRLKDWKRLTSKLGLLTGRSERQAFAGAVRSSAGTPVHSNSLTATTNPLRLTVSNQESRRLGARSGHRGSGGGDGSPAHGDEQQATNRSRLLVPGGHHHLFDGSNRRHSSQSSDVNTAAALSLPTSARKLSSSSMVVQPVSALSDVRSPGGRKGSATTILAGDCDGLKPMSGGLNQRDRRRIMSRSAAASPMLMAHQDSMCLRRSSDSEACRGGGGGGGTGGAHLQVAMGGAATPVSATAANKKDGASSRSSMSGASVFYGSDNSPSGGPPVQPSLSSLAVKTRPVVVNRDDLLHLLKVTGSSVALNVVASGDDGQDGGGGEPVQLQAAGSKDNEQAHEERRGSQETSAAIGAGSDDNNGDSGQQSASGNADEQSRGTAAQKHDLSWVVRRTSKVAVFQQKLRNKMRWHSKQKQAELGKRLGGNVTLANDDHDGDHQDHSRCMINEADKENNVGHGSATKDASNVLMDPTLIGDAIEMFLRTTMQQQLNSSECHDRDAGTAEQADQFEPFAGKDDEQTRDDRMSRPLERAPPLDRLMGVRADDTSGEHCRGTSPSLGPIERVKALPLPPPPSVIKKDDGELRQKQQQQQQASIGGGRRGSDGGQQTSCTQLTNKRTKTQIPASTG